MNENFEIPTGRFADNEDELRQKRKELKEKLLRKSKILCISSDGIHKNEVHYPAEIETIKAEGILNGDIVHKGLDTYFLVSSNSSEHQEIGRIFKERPSQFLSKGVTGFYENGELKFVVDKNGIGCQKVPYPLFESWLNGKIDIKYLVERFTADEALKRKRELLKSRTPCKLFNYEVVCFPAEIETMRGEGALYGHHTNYNYFVTSNKSFSDCSRIGTIFKEKPIEVFQKWKELRIDKEESELRKKLLEEECKRNGGIMIPSAWEGAFFNLHIALIGYYEHDVLQFVTFLNRKGEIIPEGIICPKRPYPLFESWLNGRIDIKYNL